MKPFKEFIGLSEDRVAEILVEFFEPKLPKNFLFHTEGNLIYSEFEFGNSHVRVEFDRIQGTTWEIGFTTKDQLGVFSTGLKNVSNSSLRLFNFIIGICLEFQQKYNCVQLNIVEPDYDNGKRISLYGNVIKRPEIKSKLKELGFSAFFIGGKIELIRNK